MTGRRVYGAGLKVLCSWFRVQGFGSRVQDSGGEVRGLSFRVLGVSERTSMKLMPMTTTTVPPGSGLCLMVQGGTLLKQQFVRAGK